MKEKMQSHETEKEKVVLSGTEISWDPRTRNKIIIEALLSNAVWTSGWMTGQVELGMTF